MFKLEMQVHRQALPWPLNLLGWFPRKISLSKLNHLFLLCICGATKSKCVYWKILLVFMGMMDVVENLNPNQSLEQQNEELGGDVVKSLGGELEASNRAHQATAHSCTEIACDKAPTNSTQQQQIYVLAQSPDSCLPESTQAHQNNTLDATPREQMQHKNLPNRDLREQEEITQSRPNICISEQQDLDNARILLQSNGEALVVPKDAPMPGTDPCLDYSNHMDSITYGKSKNNNREAENCNNRDCGGKGNSPRLSAKTQEQGDQLFLMTNQIFWNIRGGDLVTLLNRKT